MSTDPRLGDSRAFVVRGFLMLGAMTVLVAVVLGIILYRPRVAPPELPADLPPESSPGWQIRYNAALALARRGSAQVPWAVVREMLDEKQQIANFSAHADDRPTADVAAARATVAAARQAVAEWRVAAKDAEITPEMRSIFDQAEKK